MRTKRPIICVWALIIGLWGTTSSRAVILTPDLRGVPTGEGWHGALSAGKLIQKDDAAAIEFNHRGAKVIWIDDLEFDQGVIEFEAKGKSAPRGVGFIGVAFRGVDEKTHDAIYFRPFNFRADDAQRSIHAVQYVSEPAWPWHRLRKERTGNYEKPIDPAPDGDQWFRAKVAIKNREIRVYVNDATTPSLVVPELSERKGGAVGIWCNGYGAMANLKITHSSGWSSGRSAGGQSWSHYLGPNYDLEIASDQFAARAVSEQWKANVNVGMCSVTLADGLLYTMGNNGTKDNEAEARDTVYCLDAETGEEIWTFDYACTLDPRLHPGGPSGTPTVHDGKVYTCSKFGHIYCLDAKTGKKLWQASAEHFKPSKRWWGFAASPTVVGDVVIYNIGDRGMALNRDTGEIVWQSENSVVAYATPKPLPMEMFHRPAVALLTNEAFFVLDPATGKSVATYAKSWQEKSNCNGVTPYLHKGHVYLVHSAHGLSRLSLEGNRLSEDWLATEGKYPNEWFAFNTHVIHGDNIFYLTKGRGSSGTGLRCVDAETGKQETFNQVYDFGNLLAVGDTLVMLSEKGELIWGDINGTSFAETYRTKILEGLCWSKPVILGKRLYARDAEGTVVCLELM